MNTERRGKLAKIRRIIKHLDNAIALCETDEVFGLHEYREVQALVNALLQARACADNISMRLGDDSAYRMQPHVSVKVNYEDSA